MGQSADELRRDIEDTRSGLTDTLDAIGDRVSPGRVLERRKNRTVQSLQSVRDRVMGTITGATDSARDGAGSAADTITGAPDLVRTQTQGSPVAAGAIAFGVGFLIAAAFPASQPEQDVAQTLIDKAEPVTDELKEAGQAVAEEVKGAAQDAVEEVKSSAADSKQAIADTAQQGIEATRSTTHDAADSVKASASADSDG